jgi:hypothetical protein
MQRLIIALGWLLSAFFFVMNVYAADTYVLVRASVAGPKTEYAYDGIASATVSSTGSVSVVGSGAYHANYNPAYTHTFRAYVCYDGGNGWHLGNTRNITLVGGADVSSWPLTTDSSGFPECSQCTDELYDFVAECGTLEDVDTENNLDENGCPTQCLSNCDDGLIECGGECIYCETGEYELLSCNCIPYCPHDTGEPVGEYISYTSPETGDYYALCIVPPCGEGELEDNDGICRNNCPNGYRVDPDTGECELDCATGFEEYGGNCVAACLPGYTRGEDGICRIYVDPDPTEPDPVEPDPDPDPDKPPTDPDDDTSDSDNLKSIQENSGKILEKLNEIEDDTSDIKQNTEWIGKNTEKVVTELQELGEKTDSWGNATNERLAGIQSAVDGIQDSEYSGDVPGDSDTDYPGEVVTGDASSYGMEEVDVVQQVADYISSIADDNNLIPNIELDTSDSDSCIYLPNPITGGSDKAVCFNEYSYIWQPMGYLLVALTSLSAVFIILGKR